MTHFYFLKVIPLKPMKKEQRRKRKIRTLCERTKKGTVVATVPFRAYFKKIK
jgi:hypothetical protein